jgi:amino acid permease
VSVHAVSEKPYELAYEASIRAIEAQATLVESLRSRAGTMLAATALVTSFFGGQAGTSAG